MKQIALLSIIIFRIAAIDLYSQDVNYQDLALSQGIDHTFSNNTNGSGVSFVDFDGDGLDDITLGTNEDDVIHFYKNTGTGFVRLNNLIDLQENTKSILWVDYDNDGDKDVFIGAYQSPNKLFRNEGEMNFLDVTIQSNLPTADSLNTFGAIWGDYDRDGWLDLYYSARINSADQGVHRNRLWKNMADGTFMEVTNFANAGDEGRLPFCSAFVDMNNDLWPDIYTANDKKKRNTLLLNNANGLFTDISEESGAGIEMDAMCVAPGDYNNDGRLDIYLSNVATGGKLLTNQSNGDECVVIENAEETMVAMSGGIGWGSVFVDVNNDGWEDLYVSGMLISNDQYSSQLFVNDGLGAFSEDDFGFVGDTVRSFNNAIGDIDNDGQMEIMVINSAGFNSQLWKAEKPDANWLKVNLEGTVSNRDGIGAWISLYTEDNEQTRYTTCGNGFMGQNSENIHFGLADLEAIDSLTVTWPTGHIDRYYDIQASQILKSIEGETNNGIVNIDSDINIISDIGEHDNFESEINIYPNPFEDFIIIESSLQIIELRMYDMQGRLVLQQKENVISTIGLNSGLYTLVIIDGKQKTETRKIIKL